jgi:small GTP-binding protein
MHDLNFKVLLIGQTTVKNEFLKKYVKPVIRNPGDLRITIGTDFYTKMVKIKEITVKLQLWDVVEEGRFKFLLPTYCKGSNGAIILYDITDSNSLKHVHEWIIIIREQAGDIPIILIGNKLDSEQSREVPREEGIKIAESYNLSAFVEISTKTGENVEKKFTLLADIMINHLQPQTPKPQVNEVNNNEKTKLWNILDKMKKNEL